MLNYYIIVITCSNNKCNTLVVMQLVRNALQTTNGSKPGSISVLDNSEHDGMDPFLR